MSAQSKSMANRVYEEMKTAILYGYPNFKPGDLLNENRLAEMFNVSKTPIREALSRLRYENLVEVIPYKGYFVTNLTHQDLTDLFELRHILEISAVELAVANITPQQLSELESLTDIEKILYDEDISLSFRKLNLRFHTLIAEASGNKWMAKTIKNVVEQMQRSMFQIITQEDLQAMFEDHRLLVEALHKRDVEEVKRLVELQIEHAKSRVMQYRKVL